MSSDLQYNNLDHKQICKYLKCVLFILHMEYI